MDKLDYRILNILKENGRETASDISKAILAQEEQIEALCVKNSERALEVSLSVPRATYISYAFTDYLKDMRAFPSVSLSYKETNSKDTIRGVSSKAFDLGIIRCQALYEH